MYRKMEDDSAFRQRSNNSFNNSRRREPTMDNLQNQTTIRRPMPQRPITQTPTPMQSLPLHLQQEQENQMPADTPMPTERPPRMATPPLMQENQIPRTPTRAGDQEQLARFEDFEQLSMLQNGIPVTAESVQFLNGFLRTQIGRRIKAEFLIGTNSFLDREGTLLGVGVNYFIINETDTDDLTICDFYSVKFIKIYY